MERNPFTTLEVAKEHIDGAWVALAQETGKSPRDIRKEESGVAYHLHAAEDAVTRLYQQMAKALPGLCDVDAGEVSETIVSAIEAPPREQWSVGHTQRPGHPFYSVVSSTGKVIALQVPSLELAERISKLPELER